jgi:hypothetical protein
MQVIPPPTTNGGGQWIHRVGDILELMLISMAYACVSGSKSAKKSHPLKVQIFFVFKKPLWWLGGY